MHAPTHPFRAEIPAWLWLWLPLGTAAVIALCGRFAPAFYGEVFRGELGVVELGTPAAVLVGVWFALRSLPAAPAGARAPVHVWLVLFAIGGIYFAGEELSWGQHLFGWETPQTFSGLNDQNETNLHNTSSWLDQKPKWALRYGELLGGLVAPAVLVFLGPPKRWTFWRWLWPTYVCMPAAALALLCALSGRLAPAELPFGLGEALRMSELEELAHGLFLMIYAVSLHARLPATGREAAPSGASRTLESGRPDTP